MRLMVDILIAGIVLGVIAVIAVQRNARAEEVDRIAAVQQSMHTIENQSLYRAGIGEVVVTRRGYPSTILESWFDPPPQNILAGPTETWIEIADDLDGDRTHPRYVYTDGSRAAFWYNPHRAILRARVRMQMTEQTTLELYNLVNDSTLRMRDTMWIEQPDESAKPDQPKPLSTPDLPTEIDPESPPAATGGGAPIEFDIAPPTEVDTDLGVPILPMVR